MSIIRFQERLLRQIAAVRRPDHEVLLASALTATLLDVDDPTFRALYQASRAGAMPDNDIIAVVEDAIAELAAECALAR